MASNIIFGFLATHGLPANWTGTSAVMTIATTMNDDDDWCQREAQWEDTTRAGEEGVREPDITTTQEEHIQEAGRNAVEPTKSRRRPS